MYVFLDLEWNDKNYDVLSIGAISCDGNFKPEHSFYSLVKPKQIDKLSDEIINFIHTTKEKLIAAKRIVTVLKAFFHEIKGIDKTKKLVLIVWNKQTHVIFDRILKATGFVLPEYKVVVLQNILRFIDYSNRAQCGLKYYLTKIGYKYEENMLHHSLYDVDILSDIFMHLKRRLHKYFVYSNRVWFVKSRNSNIVHKPACIYRNNILNENLERVDISDIFCGYEVCKNCFKDIKWREEVFKDVDIRGRFKLNKYRGPRCNKSYAKVDFSDKTVQELCDRYKFNYRIASNMIYIDTLKGSWIISHDGQKILTIFHKNYLHFQNPEELSKKSMYHEGYHDQCVKLKTLYSACAYINQHDSSPKTYKLRKSRIDELFDIISSSN